MKFEVYCDESRPDLLASTSSSADFMIIGSLWLEAEKRGIFKQAIHSLRNKHKIGGEFKWQKVSPSREGFYRELMDWFFERYSALRFRCIAVSREKVNLLPFHDNDQELGFYKFYYQVLHHWVLDYNEYAVFSDFKSNRKPDRLHVMQQCLNAANLSSRISTVQMIRSKESILLQLVDVLTGAVSAKLNQSSHSGTAKARLITHIEEQLQNPIGHTAKSEQKFNVFVIDLGGGW